jgi:acetyl-CoA C-acetyltransferase
VTGETPLLAGVGVATQRQEDPSKAKEPLALMIDAAMAAGTDSGASALLHHVERVYVPQGRWRYRDAAGAIAGAIGSPHAKTVHAKVGVLQQTLIGDACRRIADGEIAAALVVGGEGGYRLSRSAVLGVEVHDTVLEGRSDEVMRPHDELTLEVEMRSGLGTMAVGYYAIMESAFRARNGWTVESHRDALAQMYSRFSAIAAKNPEGWTGTAVEMGAIRDPSPTNRMLAFPYTKRHVSSWSVDQAAALLFCSSEKAKTLGIAPEKRIFPVASTESNHMVHLAARAAIERCPGAAIAGEAALGAAELAVADVDLIDLYSCFPVAVEIFAMELGIPLAGELTVTGGMPFAGGPYNNYLFQATARMARLLRQQPGSTGLLSCVSGLLTKQGFGVWATTPPRDGFSYVDVTTAVARASATKKVLDSYDGPGTIAGYTVLHELDPVRAIAVADVSGGARSVAYSEDTSVVTLLQAIEGCGRSISITDGRFALT